LALHRGYGLVPDLRGRPPSSSIGNGPRLRTGAPLSSEDGTRTGRPGAFVAFAPEDVQRRHERVRRQRQERRPSTPPSWPWDKLVQVCGQYPGV